MERATDYTWRAYEDRTLSELLQFDSTPDTEDIGDYVDPFDSGQEFETAIPDPDEAPNIPTPLTFHPTHAISAAVIEYVPLLPEYPETHDDGFAYIVSIDKYKPEELRRIMKSTQYAMGGFGDTKNIHSAYLGCQTERKRFKCSGIKSCEFLDPRLSYLAHTKADKDLWTLITSIRQEIADSSLTEGNGELQRNSIGLYDAIKKKFLRGVACKFSRQGCEPIFRQHYHDNLSGVHSYYISCANSSRENRQDHFYTSLIPKERSLDVELLQKLLASTCQPRPLTCGVIEPAASRRPLCGVIHPQGQGKIQSHGACNVIFQTFIPLLPERYPYAIFYSRGRHSHPPPPPTKAPWIIASEVLDLICKNLDPDLKLSTFLRSPALREFCKQYKCKTLSQIHSSFAKIDKVSALLWKQRALNYPLGKGIAGLRHHLEAKPDLKEYVQEIYETSEGNFVFCAFAKQLQFLATRDAIEVDMSYKRVKGDINEVIFATMLTDHGKIITLCRVFTDQESAAGYKFIFQMVFELMSRSIGRPIRFHYLHREGIKAIVGDMGPKQIFGLGAFLQDQDTEQNQRSPTWHLVRIMIFCAIHFMRTVSKIYPNRPDNSHIERRERLNGLLSCQTEDDYYRLLDLIEEQDPNLKYWVRHKRHPVIAAGLCKACSGVRPEFFSRFRPHTNTVEQSHNKSYALGTYDSLLGAVTKSLYLDQQDLDQLENRDAFGIHHRYQADDIEARVSLSSSLRRTATIKSQNRDHLSDLRELEIQQKRQEIEDAQEERRIKRRQLELETKEQELRVAKMELERQLVAAQLEQIKRGN
ncbi:hypothetical protein N7476_000100 [Penicillium atrosanguineum]|uniref:Uncharacterized protein n=1 Tax=Penicillium atrosanguineum TaxID=1132637 RepID=A0A9W9UBB4_9EURO|nr:hypothetical protein N7476_000100 [Penicillium atrosanguineum]